MKDITDFFFFFFFFFFFIIFSGAQDRQICVWGEENGVLVRVLKGHAHWVNNMALSTAHTLRTGDRDIGLYL